MIKVTTVRGAALAVMTAFAASGAAIGLHAAQTQQGPQPWIHLDMSGERADMNMNINLPLAAIEAALALAPEAIVDGEGQLQLGGRREIPVAAIRAAWTQLRDAGDIEIASIRNGPQSIRVAREGDTLLVDVIGTDEDDAGREGDGARRADDDAEHRGGDRDDAGRGHGRDRDGDRDEAGGDRDDAERGRGRRGGSLGEVKIRVPVSVVDALLTGDGQTLDVRAAIQELSALRGEMVQVIQPDARIRVWIDESPTQ